MSKYNVMLFWGLNLALCSGASLATTDFEASTATSVTTADTKITFDPHTTTSATLSTEAILADPLFTANKELNTLQKQCLAQDHVSCLTLAMFFEGQKKFPQGQYWYEQACNLNNAAACNRLATQLANGIGPIQADQPRALKFYRQACELKHEQSCTQAGLAYYQGLSVEIDLSQALEFFTKASKLQSPQGSLFAGVFYQKGLGVPADPTQALSYFKQACDLHNGAGCFEAAKLLAGNIATETATPPESSTTDIKDTTKTASNNTTIPKDFAAATALLEKGCGLKHNDSCFALGQQYLHGLGKNQDTTKAKQLFNKACKLKSAKACAYATSLKDQK